MEPMKRSLFFLSFVATFHMVPSAKIVLAAPQVKSHVLEQLALGERLLEKGHEVYVAVGSRYPIKENTEKRGFKLLQYHVPDDVIYGISEEFERLITDLIFSGYSDDEMYYATMKFAIELISKNCQMMMEDGRFLDDVRNIGFDLAIVEPHIAGLCLAIFPKYLGIPFVSMSLSFLPWRLRLPALPSFFPLLTVWREASDVTLPVRLRNLITYLTYNSHLSLNIPENTTLLQRFAPDFYSWQDLLRQSVLFLTELDQHLGSPVPAWPNYISVAGLTCGQSKTLSKDLEDIIENSPEGIILLSFGSIAHYFPDNVIVKFFEAFSHFNQTVIARFTVPQGLAVPANVKVFSWLPQNDILGHPKTKLFITHCGNNGQHEALYHGVPIIAFPLFAEQHINCHRLCEKGFGLPMKIQDFTSTELAKNIAEVLNNPKYKNTIQKASVIFKDQPMHPRERGVFWIEHVIRHGGKHLRPVALDMSLYQLFMLDILGLFVSFAVVLIVLMVILVRCFCSRNRPSSLPAKLKKQ